MTQALELVEFLPGELYFISSISAPTIPPPPPAVPPASTAATSFDFIEFIHVEKEFKYAPFYLDFGPLHLGHVFKFADALTRKLEHIQQRSEHARDSRVCVYSSTAPQHRANAVCILGCWAILHRGWTAAQAFAPFRQLALPTFHDATRNTHDPFGLTVLHVLQGLEKALQSQLISRVTFDVDEYLHYEQVANGDLSWITPQIAAFAGPQAQYSMTSSSSSKLRPSSSVKLAPEHYIEYFHSRNVKLVIRLSKKRYEKARLTNAGFEFLDLYFPDGCNPSDAVLHKFLDACDAVIDDSGDDDDSHPEEDQGRGAVAVHCKAGLGRTGTLIACYLMQIHRFTAEEAIGWLRLCRPGSVVGPQQHFVRAKQQEMWDRGNIKALTQSGTTDNEHFCVMLQQMLPTPRPRRVSLSSSSSSYKKGIASSSSSSREDEPSPRRRASLSGIGILKKVDQLRTSSPSSFVKNSHSVTPVGGNNNKKEGGGDDGSIQAPRVHLTTALPPRIPGKQTGKVMMTQGDLLRMRKLSHSQHEANNQDDDADDVEESEAESDAQPHHPALAASAHVAMGLWPIKPRVIM